MARGTAHARVGGHIAARNRRRRNDPHAEGSGGAAASYLAHEGFTFVPSIAGASLGSPHWRRAAFAASARVKDSCRWYQRIAPRAAIGQTLSTRPPRTPTYQS